MADGASEGLNGAVTVCVVLLFQAASLWCFNVTVCSVDPFGACSVAVAELSPRRSSSPVPITNWIWLKVPGGAVGGIVSARLGSLLVSRCSGLPEAVTSGIWFAPLFESDTATLWTFQLSSDSPNELWEVSVITM